MDAATRTATHGRPKTGGLEYNLYFALIFLISLPTALVRMVIPRRGERMRFFVTEAWSMAQAVTPRIFSA